MTPALVGGERQETVAEARKKHMAALTQVGASLLCLPLHTGELEPERWVAAAGGGSPSGARTGA